ncbi:MAG: hypothetical protein ABW277_25120 [Longimicrobiaceae bacterium]
MANRAWEDQFLKYFEQSAADGQRVYTRDEIGAVLSTHGAEFGAPKTLGMMRLIEFLLRNGHLCEVRLESMADMPDTATRGETQGPPTRKAGKEQPPAGSYGAITRYVWGKASPYEIGLSLRAGAYLSHASAMRLHGLGPQTEIPVYANKEQSPKPAPTGVLTQGGIDRAFARPPRVSRYVYSFDGTPLVLLSGKHTGNLGVNRIVEPSGIPVRVTSLERTLVDVVVRPAYATGAAAVLEAYRAARERASVEMLLAILQSLAHVYPYHQAIGFYMERAGYAASDLRRVHSLGLQYDFYVEHQMAGAQFDRAWRIHYPEGL